MAVAEGSVRGRVLSRKIPQRGAKNTNISAAWKGGAAEGGPLLKGPPQLSYISLS